MGKDLELFVPKIYDARMPIFHMTCTCVCTKVLYLTTSKLAKLIAWPQFTGLSKMFLEHYRIGVRA